MDVNFFPLYDVLQQQWEGHQQRFDFQEQQIAMLSQQVQTINVNLHSLLGAHPRTAVHEAPRYFFCRQHSKPLCVEVFLAQQSSTQQETKSPVRVQYLMDHGVNLNVQGLHQNVCRKCLLKARKTRSS